MKIYDEIQCRAGNHFTFKIVGTCLIRKLKVRGTGELKVRGTRVFRELENMAV